MKRYLLKNLQGQQSILRNEVKAGRRIGAFTNLLQILMLKKWLKKRNMIKLIINNIIKYLVQMDIIQIEETAVYEYGVELLID